MARATLTMLAVLAALCLALAGQGTALAQDTPSARALASGLEASAGKTRFTLKLDHEVPYRVFALADPYRVIIDLPHMEFALPAGAGQDGAGLISAYRYGLIMVGKSRVVLDSESPVAIERAVIEKDESGAPVLTVEMAETSREAFLAAIERQRAPAPPEPPAAHDAAGMAADGEASDGKYVVVLDPGHGGIDGGAVGAGGALEKEIVLTFARALKEELEQDAGYKVLMTRDSDIFLALGDRVAFARKAGASLFVSIHADKFRGSSVRGATVYTLSEDASDAETAELAAKENKADLIAGLQLKDEPDEVTDILISLAQRETKNLSVDLAKRLVTNMDGQVRLNRNPHRFAGFRVLKAPDVPSVLLELGYVSNPSDVREMQSAKWRRKAASAIRKAIDRFREMQFAGNAN